MQSRLDDIERRLTKVEEWQRIFNNTLSGPTKPETKATEELSKPRNVTIPETKPTGVTTTVGNVTFYCNHHETLDFFKSRFSAIRKPVNIFILLVRAGRPDFPQSWERIRQPNDIYILYGNGIKQAKGTFLIEWGDYVTTGFLRKEAAEKTIDEITKIVNSRTINGQLESTKPNFDRLLCSRLIN